MILLVSDHCHFSFYFYGSVHGGRILVRHTACCTYLFLSPITIDHVNILIAAVCSYFLRLERGYEHTSVGNLNNTFLFVKEKYLQLCLIIYII